MTRGQRWFAAFVAVVSTISSVAAPVVGGVFVENSLAGDTETLGQGLVLLDIDSGSHLTIDAQADWDAGTYAATEADNESSNDLTLEHYGAIPPTAAAPWWSTAWHVRRCITINNPGPNAITEHPLEFVIDTTTTVADGEMLPGGIDLRAIDSATGLELPLWIEGDNVPSAATEIWVQLAAAPVGNSEVCLYSGKADETISASDEQAVFTYSTPKLNYYTIGTSWNGATASVVSYVDGNSIAVNGGTPQLADRGDIVTFAVNRNSVIQSTGPISGASTANPTDSIVPESLAASSFVFATNRNIQTIWVRAPFGNVTLSFQAGGAAINTTIVGSADPPAATQTITPAMGAVGIVADAAGGEGVLVQSAAGQFLAVHEGDRVTGQSTDAVVGVPWLGEAIYGVRSRYLQVVAGATGTTYSAIGSDGTNIVNQAVGATAMDTTNASPVATDRRGQGPAVRVTSAGPIVGATQFADENGSEITNFIPYSLLEHEYFLPVQANYAAIACPARPGPAQQITMTPPVGAASTLTCANPGGLAGAPGKAYVGIGTIAAGTLFESDDRFFLYIEKTGTNDEINLYAGKAAQPRSVTDPGHTIGQLEGVYMASGTWSSPAIDSGSSGVFGLIEMLGLLPPGTTASLQIASGDSAGLADAATPVGPDGTAGTSYATGTATINAIHDFDQYVRVVVSLATTDPLETPVVTSVDLASDLDELATSDIALTEINVAASPGVDSHLLTRIYSTGTLSYTAQITYQDGVNLPAANRVTVRTDLPAVHVEALRNGVGVVEIVQGQGPDFTVTPADTISLYVDEDIVAGETVTVEVRLTAVETNGVVLEHDLRLVLTAP